MNTALRPMSLGEILDRAIQVYRSRFWVFIGLSVFPAAGMTLLQLINLYWWKLRPADLLHILGINLGFFLYAAGEYHCSLFFHALVWPPLVLAASQTYLGERPGIGSSLRRCAVRWKSWTGLALIVQVLVVLVAEISAIAVMVGLAALADWLSRDNEEFMDPFMSAVMGTLIVAGYVFSLWLGTLYLQAVPTWGAEGLNLRKSLKRSRRLSQGSRWRLLAVRLAPVAMILIVDIAASSTIRLILLWVVRSMHHPFFLFSRIYGSTYVVFAGAVSLLLTPVFPIALTLVYYDQRIRKEGFDIEYMMETAGSVADAAVATTANDTELPECSPVTAEELGA